MICFVRLRLETPARIRRDGAFFFNAFIFFRKILFPRFCHAGGESGLTTPGNISVLPGSLPFIQPKFLQLSGLCRPSWGGGRAATRIGCRFDSQRERQHNITLSQLPLRRACTPQHCGKSHRPRSEHIHAEMVSAWEWNPSPCRCEVTLLTVAVNRLFSFEKLPLDGDFTLFLWGFFFFFECVDILFG